MAEPIHLSTIIAALPKPTSLTFNYPKSWATESLGLWGALADGNFSGALGSLGLGAGAGLAGNGITGAFSNRAGVTINQRNKSLFKDLPFREVQFAWSILPESPSHSARIREFLHEMKINSAPELSNTGAMFTYPSLFELEISTKSGVLFKSDALALTNLTIDYTPSGFWSQHTDGFPTKINFGMEFTELTLAVRNTLVGDNPVLV